MSKLLFAALAVSLAGCATSRSSPRTQTTYGERQAQDAEHALDAAEQKLDAMDPEGAEPHIASARSALKSPDIEYYPERDTLRGRLKKMEMRLASAKQAKVRMAREAVSARQQGRVIDAMERLDTALEPLRHRTVTVQDVDRAKEAFHRTRQVLADGRPMEIEYQNYARFAQEHEAALAKKRQEIVLAQAALAFLDGPAAQREKARGLLKEAATASSIARPSLYRQALTSLNSCKLSGKEMLTTVDHLDRFPVTIGGENTTPEAVTRFCDARAQVVEKRLAEATKEAQKAQARRVPPPLPRPKAKKK